MPASARRLLPAVVTAAAFAAPAPAAGPYDDLLKHVSPNTNTLVLVNPKAAYDSPLGKAEKWADRTKTSAHGALGFVPPDAEAVVIASEVNFTSMVRDFQIGMVKLRGNVPNMNDLAKREGGTTDDLAGRLIVFSPRDVYFTTLGGQELVAAYPADRQYTAKWMRHAVAADSPAFSKYLMKAAETAGDSVVVIALDLQDAVDAAVLKVGLSISPTVVRYKGVDIAVLAKFMSRVQGLRFKADVTDKIVGTIQVNFDGDPNPFKMMLRDLFVELLDSYGVGIAGLDQWQAQYGQTSMTLSGPLAPAELQRILSLFAFPGAESEAAAPTGGEPSAVATKRYFDALNVVLKNVRSMADSPTYEKTATWHEKAAAQLEQLSQRGVDPLATDAAMEAATRLRAIGYSLRGVPIDLNALSQQGYMYVDQQAFAAGRWRPPYWHARVPGWAPPPGLVPPGYGGWWGGYRNYAFISQSIRTNLPEIQGEMAKVVAADRKTRLEAWSQIERTTSDARRKLGEKYKSPF